MRYGVRRYRVTLRTMGTARVTLAESAGTFAGYARGVQYGRELIETRDEAARLLRFARRNGRAERGRA